MNTSIICPNCGKKSSNEKNINPFCSKRCKDIDLYKWFNGDYSIPVVDHDDISEEELEKLIEISKEDNQST